mmetsp:Transcript_20744/g.49018  ORF Transcript_20744/g.49018 Transcript_20744/m.49018 type:complete len:201 (+) Transcript_20744:316-918(+)
MHRRVSHPGDRLDDLPDPSPVRGEDLVPEIPDRPRDQEEEEESERRVREPQVRVEEPEDGFRPRVEVRRRRRGTPGGITVLFEQDRRRDVRGCSRRSAKISRQFRLDRTEPKVIEIVTNGDEPDQELSHASSAVVEEETPAASLLVEPEKRLEVVAIVVVLAVVGTGRSKKKNPLGRVRARFFDDAVSAGGAAIAMDGRR